MALSSTSRDWATLALGVGALCLLIALRDVSDETFGSSSGGLSGVISIWLFHIFGHWGPRVALITAGVLFVAESFWFASLAREEERPSDATLEPACADQRSGTKTFALLSWTLILLVFSLLAFIVVGPLLRNPTIDGVLSYLRERYSLPATTLTIIFVLGFRLRLLWKEFRETGDPSRLLRILMYLVLAIFIFTFFLLSSWEAIFWTA
jgi:hypothetical protein